MVLDMVLIELTDSYAIYDFYPEGKQEEYGRLQLDRQTGKISTLIVASKKTTYKIKFI